MNLIIVFKDDLKVYEYTEEHIKASEMIRSCREFSDGQNRVLLRLKSGESVINADYVISMSLRGD